MEQQNNESDRALDMNDLKLREQLLAAQAAQVAGQPQLHLDPQTGDQATSLSPDTTAPEQLDTNMAESAYPMDDMDLDDQDGGADERRGGKRELSSSKRAAQNRAAQRAFRQRKEGYIKKLEDQVRGYAGMEGSYKQFQVENYELRAYILQLQSRLLETQGSYPPPPATLSMENRREVVPVPSSVLAPQHDSLLQSQQDRQSSTQHQPIGQTTRYSPLPPSQQYPRPQPPPAYNTLSESQQYPRPPPRPQPNPLPESQQYPRTAPRPLPHPLPEAQQYPRPPQDKYTQYSPLPPSQQYPSRAQDSPPHHLPPLGSSSTHQQRSAQYQSNAYVPPPLSQSHSAQSTQTLLPHEVREAQIEPTAVAQLKAAAAAAHEPHYGEDSASGLKRRTTDPAEDPYTAEAARVAAASATTSSRIPTGSSNERDIPSPHRERTASQ